jgi:hypothetical protein
VSISKELYKKIEGADVFPVLDTPCLAALSELMLWATFYADCLLTRDAARTVHVPAESC